MSDYIAQIYQQLSSKTFSEAKLSFQQLSIKDHQTGDLYFQTYGVGNVPIGQHIPYERFLCYERLLDLLQETDMEKYYKIHKGTPYYFLAWTALQFKDFERALFYMDAAIAEDMRVVGNGWVNAPMGRLLRLEEKNEQGSYLPAFQVTIALKENIEEVFAEFKKRTSQAINLSNFLNKFVIKLINKDKKNRSIITAFYVFLLEYKERAKLLKLRSVEGGTIEIILAHLFNGGLIFESLLKYLYPTKDDGKTETKKLDDIFKTEEFKTDFFEKVKQGASSLKSIYSQIKGGQHSLQMSFDVTSQLRNTTSHDLAWDDIFDNPQVYQDLYEQIADATLFTIRRRLL